MSFTVYIRENLTGEVRIGSTTDAPWDFGHEYLWSEGNFGCDCNRAIFFYQGALDVDDTCGHNKYSIRVVSEDGELLYEEYS